MSNTYLVAAEPGGDGVLIDAGGPMEPLYEAIEKHGVNVTHLLLTHHHHDHVSEAAEVKERYGCEVVAHPIEAELIDDGVVDRTIDPGTVIESGGLSFEALHTPGHTAGMISFRTPDAVFTGDTLFKGSVGGVRAPGASCGSVDNAPHLPEAGLLSPDGGGIRLAGVFRPSRATLARITIFMLFVAAVTAASYAMVGDLFPNKS